MHDNNRKTPKKVDEINVNSYMKHTWFNKKVYVHYVFFTDVLSLLITEYFLFLINNVLIMY